MLYGAANPFLAAAEIGSLAGLVTLVLLLRFCLRQRSAPSGLFRDVLDFLAMADWHPAVCAGLIGLLALTTWWFFRTDQQLFFLWGIMGLRRALQQSGDFRDELDRVITLYQWTLTAGVPLLFVLHILTRWTPRRRILPWVLVPVLFVATAIGTVILVTIVHQ